MNERVREIEAKLVERNGKLVWKKIFRPNDADFLIQTIKLQQEQIKRYEETLKFYADEKNYEINHEQVYAGYGDFIEDKWIPVKSDKGFHARGALNHE